MAFSLSGLKKTQSGPAESARPLSPETRVSSIVKVGAAGYVPAGVEVRARIDDHMFTGVMTAAVLAGLESDPQVVSVSPAQPLPLIAPRTENP